MKLRVYSNFQRCSKSAYSYNIKIQKDKIYDLVTTFTKDYKIIDYDGRTLYMRYEPIKTWEEIYEDLSYLYGKDEIYFCQYVSTVYPTLPDPINPPEIRKKIKLYNDLPIDILHKKLSSLHAISENRLSAILKSDRIKEDFMNEVAITIDQENDALGWILNIADIALNEFESSLTLIPDMLAVEEQNKIIDYENAMALSKYNYELYQWKEFDSTCCTHFKRLEESTSLYTIEETKELLQRYEII